MTNTAASVLAHHGITADSPSALIDAARDHGVLTACLGCGSIITAPAGMTTEDYKAANPWFNNDVQTEWAECCSDFDSEIY